MGRPEKLDVIDLLISGSGNSLLAERLTNRPGNVCELLDIVQRELHAVVAD